MRRFVHEVYVVVGDHGPAHQPGQARRLRRAVRPARLRHHRVARSLPGLQRVLFRRRRPRRRGHPARAAARRGDRSSRGGGPHCRGNWTPNSVAICSIVTPGSRFRATRTTSSRTLGGRAWSQRHPSRPATRQARSKVTYPCSRAIPGLPGMARPKLTDRDSKGSLQSGAFEHNRGHPRLTLISLRPRRRSPVASTG